MNGKARTAAKRTKTQRTTPTQLEIVVVERRTYRVPVNEWATDLRAMIATGKITDDLEERIGDLEYHFGPEEVQTISVKVAR